MLIKKKASVNNINHSSKLEEAIYKKIAAWYGMPSLSQLRLCGVIHSTIINRKFTVASKSFSYAVVWLVTKH